MPTYEGFEKIHIKIQWISSFSFVIVLKISYNRKLEYCFENMTVFLARGGNTECMT